MVAMSKHTRFLFETKNFRKVHGNRIMWKQKHACLLLVKRKSEWNIVKLFLGFFGGYFKFFFFFQYLSHLVELWSSDRNLLHTTREITLFQLLLLPLRYSDIFYRLTIFLSFILLMILMFMLMFWNSKWFYVLSQSNSITMEWKINELQF